MDKAVIFIIIAIVLAGVLFWAWQGGIFAPKEVLSPEGILLFYGADCPHCKNVENFIAENKIAEKMQFTQLEIPFNGKTSAQLKANAELLVQKAQTCKLDISAGVSIPFLYDPPSGEAGGKGNCLVGDEPVINFFKNEAGIK